MVQPVQSTHQPRRPAEVSGRYCFSWGNQFYERWRDGRPVTLGECLDACYGVGAAQIWRINADETISLVVEQAGSDVEVVYAPTGRRIRRRPRRSPRLG
jgi:hypothetical protein